MKQLKSTPTNFRESALKRRATEPFFSNPIYKLILFTVKKVNNVLLNFSIL